MGQRRAATAFALGALRQPQRMAAGRPGQEIQPADVAAQHALLPVRDQRVEQAVAREELARVLAHPQPGAHLQRQRQEDRAGVARLRAQAQVIPQVAVREVEPALRLEDIGVMHLAGIEQRLQRMQLRQPPDRLAAAGVRKPDPVMQPEAGMAVHRQAEGPAEQLLLDHLAQRLALGLHRRTGRAAVPGQGRTQALAADQEGHPADGILRRIAHQVDALRIGARAQPQPARIDQRHEDQPERLELALLHPVPGQAADQRAQIGQHHLGADALQAVHAAEQADRRRLRILAAHRHHRHRQTAARHLDLAGGAHPNPGAGLGNQPLQLDQRSQLQPCRLPMDLICCRHSALSVLLVHAASSVVFGSDRLATGNDRTATARTRHGADTGARHDRAFPHPPRSPP